MANFTKQTIEAELAQRIQHELDRRAANSDFSKFVLYQDPSYLMGWVHQEICDSLDQFLEDVEAKKSPRLIICMPPRSGKSQLVSRDFPAYAFGRNPDTQIIATSYGDDLATGFNKDVQRIIDSEEYSEVFPDTRLPHGSDGYKRTSDLFEIVGHKGMYRSAGVGGGITGRGADILIIDDPLKDRANADSARVREGIWNWYTSTAYTRLSPGGGVIVMATRWHQDDLIGRLIKHMNEGDGDTFKVINYPAIAECDEKHRKAGEALHPDRYDESALEKIRITIGSRDWASLYQQHPVPEGGAIFKLDTFRRWNKTNLPPQFDTLIGSWDMTFKDNATNDYVVGQVWGKKGVNFYLLDLVRGQWDFMKTLEIFQLTAQKWSRVTRWLIEDKANGTAIISVLRKHIHGITPIQPDGSKIERAYSCQPLFESGNIYLPESETWLPSYEDEMINFPSGAHDDQVDSTTQALNYMKEHIGFHIHESNLVALKRPRFR